MILEHLLQPVDLLGGVAQRRAFGQFQIDHQLQSPRRREKLLRHETEHHHREHEQAKGEYQHRFTPPYTPTHHAPHALIEGRTVRVGCPRAMFGRMDFRQVRQQPLTQIGHEHHCRNPGRQQRDGHHLEDRTGVFTGA